MAHQHMKGYSVHLKFYDCMLGVQPIESTHTHTPVQLPSSSWTLDWKLFVWPHVFPANTQENQSLDLIIDRLIHDGTSAPALQSSLAKH